MIINNKIKVKWNPANKKHFESKGYIFTKIGNEFEIDVFDLSPDSHFNFDLKCDICGSVYPTKIRYYLDTKKTGIELDYCKKCRGVKFKQIFINSVKNINRLEIYKDCLDNKISKLPKNFWQMATIDELKQILNYFINRLIEDNIISNVDELPIYYSQKLLRKYQLFSLFREYDIYELINFAYPNKWKMWEFNYSPNGYWNNENNIKEAGFWLVDRLIKDNIIKSIEDIPSISCESVFVNYGLKGMFASKFNNKTFSFWNFLYPSKWYEWEFLSVPKNYWIKKENRINALKQLIDRLNIEKENIPKIISYSFLYNNYLRFSTVCDKYYSSNIYKWINEIYPNQFTPEDFNIPIACDGTKLDSFEERLIHEWLIQNFVNVKYYDNNSKLDYKWYDEKEDKNYVSDWLISNHIIVEYFGLYNLKATPDYFKSYVFKTQRKIDFYSNLNNYYFIALFPNDLKQDLKGVKNKFDKYLSKVS